jgi:hypothetical protein
MQTLPIARQLAALALIVGSATSAQAFSLSTSGNLAYNDDVADVTFTLASSTAEVRLWTDSFHSGVNFDPVLTLWKRVGSDYALVSGADDDSGIGPGQTYFDAGLKFATLAAGDYLASITASPYLPNLIPGTLRSQGFEFADPTIVHTLISQWDQPSSTDNNQKGTFWSLNVATGVVPEPDLSALLALGLSVLGWMSYRSRSA